MKVYLLSVVLASAAASAKPPSFEFINSATPQGWTAGHDIGELRLSAEGLVVPVSGKDPYLISPIGDYRSEGPLIFTASVKSPAAGWAQLFFYQKGASERQSLHLRVQAGWNDLAIPIPVLGEGWRLRFDLPSHAGDYVLARTGMEELGTQGVTHVAATDKALTLTLRGMSGRVEIAELLSHEDPTQLRTERVAWSGVASGDPLTVNIPRLEGKRDRWFSAFVARSAETRRPFGVARYAEDLAALAPDQRPFPTPPSKKGLQFQELPDALALGIKHGTINVSMGALLQAGQNANNPTWEVDGQTFAFNGAYLRSLPVRQLTEAGANVYLILLGSDTNQPAVNRIVHHPDAHRPLPNDIAAFNTETEDGARALRATCEFLAHWFSQANDEHGRIAGIIVGNEVNAHWQWYNFGDMPPAAAVLAYEKALRIAHSAVRKTSATARVYTSFTHHWTAQPSGREMGSKPFLEHLTRLTQTSGDFDWHIAFHPYPENLFEPRFWQDAHANRDLSTPVITFKNLDLLTTWLTQKAGLYRGEARRVILSEQGFHSDNTPAGDEAQAAAYCLAWEKVARLPLIDAFILHRHVDHQGEGGLNLGLWRRKAASVATPETKRLMYECFKAAGTPGQAEVFKFALPIVGLKNWDAAMPAR